MAKPMTLADIEALTKEFAAARTEMMTVGEQLNIELQAVRDKHADWLRALARVATNKADRLYAAIDANRALFETKGAKSKVFDGIKVGLQKGKASVKAASGGKIDAKALYAACGVLPGKPDDYVAVSYKAVAAAIGRLDDDQLASVGLKRSVGKDTPLINPVDGEAAKVVDALIKEFIAE